MNTVRILQTADGSKTDTYTLTVHRGEFETEYLLPQSTGIDVTIECDSVEIERTGVFTSVTVTPSPAACVTLTSAQPVVFPVPDQGRDILFLVAFFFWVWFTVKLLS